MSGVNQQDCLQQLVTSLLNLEQNLRNWHWHIKGPHFHAWHEFFGAEYKWVAEQIDTFAERMRLYDYRVSFDGVEACIKKRNTTYLEKESVEQCLVDYWSLSDWASQNLLGGKLDPITEDMVIDFITTLQEKIWHISSHNSDGGY